MRCTLEVTSLRLRLANRSVAQTERLELGEVSMVQAQFRTTALGPSQGDRVKWSWAGSRGFPLPAL